MPAERRRDRWRSTSARSTLLTVLGEFVHASGRPAWTTTLLAALGATGVEEKSARQALTRTAAEGLLVSSRHGRRVLWSLSEQGRRLLSEGTERIYGFLRDRPPWDGRWLVLTVPVPETQRALRHRLRSRLAWLGLGSPAPGLWITPDTGHRADVAGVVGELGLQRLAFAWVGESADIGSPARLIGDAWDLVDVRRRYERFVTEFEGREPGSDVEAFVAQVELVQAWRRFPFLDPDLPAELLDHDWSGRRAAAAFHALHARWRPSAATAWRAFEETAGPVRLRLRLRRSGTALVALWSPRTVSSGARPRRRTHPAPRARALGPREPARSRASPGRSDRTTPRSSRPAMARGPRGPPPRGSWSARSAPTRLRRSPSGVPRKPRAVSHACTASRRAWSRMRLCT